MEPHRAIDIQELRKTYREGIFRRRRQQALRGVSLAVQPGEVFGLLGPNGAGKTTLIKILLGIVHKSGGTASLLGHPAGSQISRSRVGYLPENLRVARHHTARTALNFYGRLSRMSTQQIARRSDELLELVGLRQRDRESVRGFSKGMGQRLGLAQALLHDPDLLILDEPTDGLDPLGRSQVRDIINELKGQGKTIFLNSHILQEVEMICDRFAILAQGELKAIGSIDDLRGSNGEASATMVVSSFSTMAAEKLTQTDVAVTTEAIQPDLSRLRIDKCPQADLDRVVDLLRSEGASIHQIQRGSSTLEQIFLSLVQPQPPESL
ncbi:putative ABC transporter ATP-binding protein YxlF [Rosistilla carotiformis]|uniref:Putative ABC transporter ATP-binding protein YxlF n=1 Tax=Rosistilla carotiformis TaxID=2528017 RepID=A0A518JX78_9BACT|nr:ABC transporter ATP-binding protein [Rosistilla carotiformis]QDV70141.1 putative ABC transporter ATP-binding protein YxlF [Rosistilla carotiformis]